MYSTHAVLRTKAKQTKIIAIQSRIDHIGERYYDSFMSLMKYLHGFSYTLIKREKMILCNFFLFLIR
jgi:DNA-binding ferritin-like protein (Dps family)